MEFLISYLMTWVGVPYGYGQSSLYQTDCSGLVYKTLKTFNVYTGPRLSAQGLFDLYSTSARWNDQRPGALVFFGKDSKNVDHVGILVSANQMIEARGGDHTTTSLDLARQQDAVVEISYYKHRADFLAIIRPSYPFDL